MIPKRPHSPTLRGAASNESRLLGGGPLAGETTVNRRRRTYSRIARALLAVWLLCWPLSGLAQQPAADKSGCKSKGSLASTLLRNIS